MTPLGKPLVFFLKYWAEMDRLYGNPDNEDEELDLLQDAEQVKQMAGTIGDIAFKQATGFLFLCGDRIEIHFSGLGNTTVGFIKKRDYVTRNWEWGAKICVPKIPGGEFWCGVTICVPLNDGISLEKDVCGVVVPWVWSNGGPKAEEAIWGILGGGKVKGWPYSRAGKGLAKDWDRGTVLLACIPVKALPPGSFDVDCDPLIEEVSKTIARIGTKEAKAIATFVAGLKEPDNG